MITLKLSGHFLGRFFTQGVLYEPILIQHGLPEQAQYVGVRADPLDAGIILVDFTADGPDRVLEAKLVNVEPLARNGINSLQH